MKSLFHPSLPLCDLFLRVILVYSFILVLLRISGKRQVAQMGMAEFVALLLISNAVQNAMNGGDNSLTAGLFLAAALMGLSYLFHFFAFKSRRFEQLMQGR